MTTDTETTLSVFITAGTSGVGRILTHAMVTKGYKVTAMTTDNDGAEVIRANGGLPVFADPSRAGEIKGMLQMAQADIIIDLSVPASVGLPFHMDVVDGIVEHTAALLDAAQAAEVKLLVFGSHALLYNAENASEDAPLNAVGSALVDALKKADKMVQASDVPSCILRAGYVYGPHSDELAKVAEVLKTGTIAVATGKKAAAWVHEDDLADAALLAVEHQSAGQVFNITDDAPATTRAFLSTLAHAHGLQLPPSYMRLLGRSYSNRGTNALLGLGFSANNAKVKAALGWQPKHPTHAIGIEQTLLSWRAGLA